MLRFLRVLFGKCHHDYEKVVMQMGKHNTYDDDDKVVDTNELTMQYKRCRHCGHIKAANFFLE